ncbi:hypothetical protein XBO1_2000014 [Xenorhabdus bovienii str. oregonense]|uniref:Uncharacterized protein n=1 Tax=Xenorhabdus bovienii str. oregonense TaxID=1398202 RepID=A0A077P4R0_XENBV|nr:hypothetical protein [Xenorhabdus bovienii]CDH05759.1 hypothetical protein XBO1_2000014 [Xenorhabdus bovienii str. oregonense]
MNNDVIDIANEIEKLQIKAAIELSNSWTMEKIILTIAIVHHLLEKGDKEQAMDWMEGLLDWTGEDLLSEAENNASDLNGWVNKRTENEVCITKALEIIRAETPDIEAMRKAWIASKEKLAEYENMEPVAWQFEWLDVSTGHWRFNTSECKSDIDSIKYKVRNIIPLYHHPNK